MFFFAYAYRHIITPFLKNLSITLYYWNKEVLVVFKKKILAMSFPDANKMASNWTKWRLPSVRWPQLSGCMCVCANFFTGPGKQYFER